MIETPSDQSPSDTLPFGDYFVAVVDILGQEAEVRKLSAYRKANRDDPELVNLMKETFGVVQGVRDMFRTVYRGYLTVSGDLHPVIRSHVEMTLESKVKFQLFADTVVAYVSLTQHPYPIFGVHAALYACAAVFLCALAGKHPLRGGVEIGTAFEIGEGDIYGPAPLEAHHLEQNVAEYPRIVVGAGVRPYLEAVRGTGGSGIDGDLSRSCADECLEFLGTDVDGSTIVDYLGHTFQGYLRKSGTEGLIHRARDSLQEQRVRMANAGKTKLAFRYELALRYFSSKGIEITATEGTLDATSLPGELG
jgi:hypothetical protein